MNRALQIALALFVIVGFPCWDWFHTRHLKANCTPEARVVLYKTVVVVLWVTAGCAVWLTGSGFGVATEAGLPQLPIPAAMVLGLLGGAVVGILISLAMVYRNEKVAAKFASGLGKLSYMLPRSGRERGWFVLVSVSAGVCEELIYRGFLPHCGIMTLGLPWVPVVVISLLAFGFAHTYQGVSGIALTTLLGAVFMVVYVGSGLLWPAMLIHALIDVRIALLPKRAMPA